MPTLVKAKYKRKLWDAEAGRWRYEYADAYRHRVPDSPLAGGAAPDEGEFDHASHLPGRWYAGDLRPTETVLGTGVLLSDLPIQAMQQPVAVYVTKAFDVNTFPLAEDDPEEWLKNLAGFAQGQARSLDASDALRAHWLRYGYEAVTYIDEHAHRWALVLRPESIRQVMAKGRGVKGYLDRNGQWQEGDRPKGIGTMPDMPASRQYAGVANPNEWAAHVDAQHEPVARHIPKINQKLGQLIQGQRVFVRMPHHVLPDIADSGTIKSQIETQESYRNYAPRRRKEFEQRAFGYDHDLNPAHRPIYGYLSDQPDGDLTRGKHGLHQYGEVAIKLRPHVHARTTFNHGDSADNSRNLTGTFRPITMPQPMTAPTHRALMLNSDGERSAWKHAKHLDDTVDGMAHPYYEAQIHHDGVSSRTLQARDIEEVIVHRNAPRHDPETIQALERAGIKYRHLADEQNDR